MRFVTMYSRVQFLFRALEIVSLLWLATASRSGPRHVTKVTAAIIPWPEMDNVYPENEELGIRQDEILSQRRRVLATDADNKVNTSSTEATILLKFREAITGDPDGILTSWNASESLSVCSWSGVLCDSSNHVTTLNLSDHQLVGNISPLLGSLRFLSSLILAGNNLTGTVPSSLGTLQHLRHLDFSRNSLSSVIPPELFNCSSLSYLNLSTNSLSGSIPRHLGSLQNLSYISMDHNRFSASIPRDLGNCSGLQYLDLSSNHLTGTVPSELARLRRLSHLALTENFLSGSIPISIANCTSLTHLSLAANNLTGRILPELGELRHLQSLWLYETDLGGSIPASLGNLTSLVILDLGCHPLRLELHNFEVSQHCPLTGSIPPELGRLRNLTLLRIDASRITGSIPEELGNLPNLGRLLLIFNQLTGRIPPALGNLSAVWMIALTGNQLGGEIPSSLGRLGNVGFLTFRKNKLTGGIPAEFGNLTRIWRLRFNQNRLTGPVISELGKLASLQELGLEDNRFSGDLPVELGNCTLLEMLYLSFNNISGSLPVGMVSSMTALYYLDFTNNQLSGSIPEEVGYMKSLQYLNLSFNNLYGSIPSSIEKWYDIRSIDVSHNQISGRLPIHALESLVHLENFTVANNKLEGPIPDRVGAFVNMTADSYIGNVGLCGPLLGKNCSKQSKSECHGVGVSCHRLRIYVASGAVGIVLAVLIITLLLLLCWKSRVRNKRSADKSDALDDDAAFGNENANLEDDDALLITKYGNEYKLTLEDLWAATSGYSELNVLGIGGQSTVYKAILPHGDGTTFAVKRMRLHESDMTSSNHGLDHELRFLRKVRHRNLVKLYGCCTTQRVIALLMEYVPNGNLRSHLHRKESDGQGKEDPGIQLTLEKRIKIATGVADAMTYLHHECHEAIIHSDLKPSNILLDYEFNAKIADFGISRYVRKGRVNKEATVSALYGTTGYIPPEYATSNRVSTRGDVYSYGVVLLELMTGKQPTDETFAQNGTWLADWVRQAFPHRIADILDDRFRTELETNKEVISRLVRVGLLCTLETASARPSMQDIQAMLAEIFDHEALDKIREEHK